MHQIVAIFHCEDSGQVNSGLESLQKHHTAHGHCVDACLHAARTGEDWKRHSCVKLRDKIQPFLLSLPCRNLRNAETKEQFGTRTLHNFSPELKWWVRVYTQNLSPYLSLVCGSKHHISISWVRSRGQHGRDSQNDMRRHKARNFLRPSPQNSQGDRICDLRVVIRLH